MVTLRIVALALVYLTAEYGIPVWLNSSYTGKIDSPINKSHESNYRNPKTDHTISVSSAGKYYVLQSQKKRSPGKHEGTKKSLLSLMMKTIARIRLKSRKPSW